MRRPVNSGGKKKGPAIIKAFTGGKKKLSADISVFFPFLKVKKLNKSTRLAAAVLTYDEIGIVFTMLKKLFQIKKMPFLQNSLKFKDRILESQVKKNLF